MTVRFSIKKLLCMTLAAALALICGGCALISLAVGLGLFKHNQDKFVLYM